MGAYFVGRLSVVSSFVGEKTVGDDKYVRWEEKSSHQLTLPPLHPPSNEENQKLPTKLAPTPPNEEKGF